MMQFVNPHGSHLYEHQNYGAFNAQKVLMNVAATSEVENFGNTIRVSLSTSACRLANDVAGRRAIENLYAGKHQGTRPLNLITRHFVGALVECGFSIAYGIFWDGRKGCDVGEYEIRGTQIDPGESAFLRVYKGDPDNKPVVLGIVSIGQTVEVEFAGWTFAADGKRPDLWGSPPWDHAKQRQNFKAYWVDQNDLHPMSALPKF